MYSQAGKGGHLAHVAIGDTIVATDGVVVHGAGNVALRLRLSHLLCKHK